MGFESSDQMMDNNGSWCAQAGNVIGEATGETDSFCQCGADIKFQGFRQKG